MKFCSRCGSTVTENTKFCASCGTATGSGAAPSAGPRPASTGKPDSQKRAAGAAPWLATESGSGRSEVRNALAKGRATFARIPRPVVYGVAGCLAVGVGVSAALMMREPPTTQINTKLYGQQAPALQQAPNKKWSISSEELTRAAGIGEDSSSSTTVNLLDYGTNGMILTSVKGPESAVVAIKEGSGKAVWKVSGDFSSCISKTDASGWLCTYTPAGAGDSTDPATSTSKPQLVALDNNGRLSKLSELSASEQLIRDAQGAPWLVAGLDISGAGDETDDGAYGDGASGGEESGTAQSVKVSKLDGSGKTQWRFERNLTGDQPLTITGLASLPLFTVDGITYLRGVADSDGKGLALDEAGRQTDKAQRPVLGNDRGRIISTNDKGRYTVGGEKMKLDTSKLSTPMMTDTSDVPMFNQTGQEWQKLNPDGTDVDWKKSVQADPVAYCGKTTVFKGLGDSNAWFVSENGDENWSGSLDGDPQFCWGGSQLVIFDSSTGTVAARNVSDGKTAWSTNLGTDEYGGSQASTLRYSPTTNGFVAEGTEGLSYWGK